MVCLLTIFVTKVAVPSAGVFAVGWAYRRAGLEGRPAKTGGQAWKPALQRLLAGDEGGVVADGGLHGVVGAFARDDGADAVEVGFEVGLAEAGEELGGCGG